MDDKLEELFRNRKEKEKRQEQDYKAASKQRLQKLCNTKIRTTMIGALDIIEGALKEYLDSETEGGKELKLIYDRMRQEILDKGNTQIRNLEKEFEQYEVTWLRYSMNIPVLGKNT